MPVLDTYGTDPEIVVTQFVIAGAAAADYDGFMLIGNGETWEVVRVDEAHQTAGSATSASVDVRKITDGQAKASGTSVLAAVIDLSQAANTRQTPALNATLANRRLAASDRLGLVGAGTLTAVDGVTVQVVLRRY